MVKRKTAEKKSHDESVKAIAEDLKADNWDVKTNESAEKPSKVGAFTPDIEATKKGGLRRFCEVLTEKDFKGDRQRFIEFRNYCDEYDFHFFVVDKDGKRRQVDPRTLGNEKTATK